MSNIRALAQRCIFEAAALAGVERYDDCQAVLRSRRHPQALNATVDIIFDGKVCRATIHSVVDGKNLPEKKLTNVSWQLIAAGALRALPAELFAEAVLTGRVTATDSDGIPLNTFGDSLTNTLSVGAAIARAGVPPARESNANVHGLLAEAIKIAVDFVAVGSGNSAQISVDSANQPFWVNIDAIEDSFEGWLYACSNDRDAFIGQPPSFSTFAHNPSTLNTSLLAFLSDLFADAAEVKVTVVRRNPRGDQPLLTFPNAHQ